MSRTKADPLLASQALLKETEKLLDTWKHPDPYAHPTAPGGTYSVRTDMASLRSHTDEAYCRIQIREKPTLTNDRP